MVSIVATIIKKNTTEDIIVVNELITKFFVPVKFDITLVIVFGFRYYTVFITANICINLTLKFQLGYILKK